MTMTICVFPTDAVQCALHRYLGPTVSQADLHDMTAAVCLQHLKEYHHLCLRPTPWDTLSEQARKLYEQLDETCIQTLYQQVDALTHPTHLQYYHHPCTFELKPHLFLLKF